MKNRNAVLLVLGAVFLFTMPLTSARHQEENYTSTITMIEKEVITLECPAVKDLTSEQKDILVQSIQIGEKRNLGFTLAAIAWVESQAGMYPINANTHAYSPYHVLLKTAMKRRDVQDTPFNRSMLASKLVNDLEYSADLALEEIEYWQKVRGKKNTFDWLASYNGGWKAAEKSESINYANKVMRKTKQLQNCASRETVLVASI